MILLDDTKSLNILVNDKTNGIGQLHPLSAIVDEELNGIYELNFTISTDEKHFQDLKNGSLVKCNAGEVEGQQIFRVQRISKPINNIVSVYCRHISYDLGKVLVKPFSSTGATQTVTRLLSNVVGTYPFTMTTNISNTTSQFNLTVPKTFRECLGGWEGSILDVFRPEYEYDNITVKMLSRRGSDTNVRIAYGKNITDLNQEESIENVYDACIGYVTINDTTTMGDVQYVNQTTSPRILIVDFTSEFDYDSAPTKAQINTLAKEYATNNKINEPTVNLTVSFVPLWQTEEYKDIAPLEKVGLGDKVLVDFPKLNVSASARVVSRSWNVLLERYESIELGDTKANLTTAISNTFNTLNQSNTANQNFIEAEMNQLASLIINGLGLHKTLVETDGGGYRYYLHNKATLAESDTQYIFTSEGLLVSTDYGQTFNAGFDSQGNAVLNSLATITLKALEIYGATISGSTINAGGSGNSGVINVYNASGTQIGKWDNTGITVNNGTISGTAINGSTITFGDTSSNYITAQTYNNQGVSFDGTGYIRMQPQGRFEVNNNGKNNLSLYSTNSQNIFSAVNYDNNGNTSNSMSLSSNVNTGQTSFYLYNYAKVNDGYVQMNSISMNGGSTNNILLKSAFAQLEIIGDSSYATNGTIKLTSTDLYWGNSKLSIIYNSQLGIRYLGVS